MTAGCCFHVLYYALPIEGYQDFRSHHNTSSSCTRANCHPQRLARHVSCVPGLREAPLWSLPKPMKLRMGYTTQRSSCCTRTVAADPIKTNSHDGHLRRRGMESVSLGKHHCNALASRRQTHYPLGGKLIHTTRPCTPCRRTRSTIPTNAPLRISSNGRAHPRTRKLHAVYDNYAAKRKAPSCASQL